MRKVEIRIAYREWISVNHECKCWKFGTLGSLLDENKIRFWIVLCQVLFIKVIWVDIFVEPSILRSKNRDVTIWEVLHVFGIDTVCKFSIYRFSPSSYFVYSPTGYKGTVWLWYGTDPYILELVIETFRRFFLNY